MDAELQVVNERNIGRFCYMGVVKTILLRSCGMISKDIFLNTLRILHHWKPGLLCNEFLQLIDQHDNDAPSSTDIVIDIFVDGVQVNVVLNVYVSVYIFNVYFLFI